MSVLKTLTEEEQQMAINYRETAEQILAAIGGEENISSATHCVTRLRLVLKDENEVDTSGLEAIEAVKGTFTASGQFQIILGNGVVDKVYKELMALTGREEQSKDEVKAEAAKKEALCNGQLKCWRMSLSRFCRRLSQLVC